MNGKIKFYNSTRGYGFIINEETKQDHFFHITGLMYDTPQKDDVVSFDLEKTEKGEKCINIYKQ